MTFDYNWKLILSSVLLALICRLDVIHGCSGGSSEKTEECSEESGMIDDSTLPKFTWNITDETNMTTGPFLLNVEFHNGTKDVAILMTREYNGTMEEGILRGDLKHEVPTVDVAVTGNPNTDTFDVVMHSKHHEGGVYQIKDGKTYEIVRDRCHDDYDHEVPDNETSGNYSHNSNGNAPKSFTITLSLHYDNNFKRVVGKGSDNTARRKIREIVNAAGPIFKSESWKLGHSITLEELEITHVNEDLTLEGGRESEAKIIRMERTNRLRATDADNYHYFAWDNGGGISGIAGLGTVCRTSRNPRTAITEWIGGADSHYAENQCVLTFAHELGHALNMPHDFNSRPGDCRKDRNGANCCQQSTVMDYYQEHVKKWSTCSTEAMNSLNFNTQRCQSKGNDATDNGDNGNGGTNCPPDETWAQYYCQNNAQYGGCNGQYQEWFKAYCKTTCSSC